MWPFLILSVSLASWALVSVLNQRVMTHFADARSEVKAGQLLFVHDCGVKNGKCAGGYSENVPFAEYSSTTNYYYSYTLSEYKPSEGYLPLVVKFTENSAICVNKSGTTFNPVPGASSQCESTFPAEIASAPKLVNLPDGAIVLYQKK